MSPFHALESMSNLRILEESGKESACESRWLNARAALTRAAHELAAQAHNAKESHRYRLTAQRLEVSAFEDVPIPSDTFLSESPYVVMTSGGTRTLIEMLVEDSSEFDLVRIAKLLLRSLDWKLPR